MSDSGTCEVCGREIKVSIFKNSGVCCELCRKLRFGEMSREEYDKGFRFGARTSHTAKDSKQ